MCTTECFSVWSSVCCAKHLSDWSNIWIGMTEIYCDLHCVTHRHDFLVKRFVLFAFLRKECVNIMFRIVIVKISPITGPRCPEGSRKLRFPDYVAVAQDGGKVVSLTCRPLLTPRKYSWYSFLLERLSRPEGHSAIGRIMSMKNSNDTSWNRSSDLPICSTEP